MGCCHNRSFRRLVRDVSVRSDWDTVMPMLGQIGTRADSTWLCCPAPRESPWNCWDTSRHLEKPLLIIVGLSGCSSECQVRRCHYCALQNLLYFCRQDEDEKYRTSNRTDPRITSPNLGDCQMILKQLTFLVSTGMSC